MLISIAQASETVANGATGENSLMSFLPFIVMIVALYFIMIRPQMKRQKEHRALIDSLTVGDEVVTSSGIYGNIASIDNNIVHLTIANNLTIKIQRPAIIQVLPKGSLTQETNNS